MVAGQFPGAADRVPLVLLDDADDRWCAAVRAHHEDVLMGEGPDPVGVVLVTRAVLRGIHGYFPGLTLRRHLTMLPEAPATPGVGHAGHRALTCGSTELRPEGLTWGC